ncbi:MAG: metallophosphoesterase [Paludibacteraceae bacterium]|nr:metallophosphoesterase [Paludibacteraceae bacterium]
MRKWIIGILITLLLAGGAVLCVIRWQAWFGTPAEPRWTGDTLSYVFPYPDTTWADSISDPTFLVLGDIHNNLTRANYDTLAARVPDAVAVIQAGDFLDRGQEYYRQLLLREWTNSALMGLPVIACPGNHEYSKGVHKVISPIWEETFTHPNNGPIAVPGVSYFLDCEHIRFIIIDTNPLVRMVDLTRTLTWLRNAMYTADNRYIVVVMHHPVLSAGKGRFNAIIYTAFRHALGEADLVIAGHDHSYMRRAPFVVLNAAGKPKPQHEHMLAQKTDSVPVYGVLQSSVSNLQFKVYRLEDNTLIDSLYVSHD